MLKTSIILFRKYRRATWLSAALAAALFGCGAPVPANTAQQNAPTPEQARSPAKDPAPAVTLANAETVKALVASAKGKVLVVNVWATFFVPCGEEMPELAQFYRERNPQRVEFISLNADPAYSLDDTVKSYVTEKKLPFPAYVLDELPPEGLNAILGTSSTGWTGELPATFVFDAAGGLKKAWLERVHLKDLAAAVADANPKG